MGGGEWQQRVMSLFFLSLTILSQSFHPYLRLVSTFKYGKVPNVFHCRGLCRANLFPTVHAEQIRKIKLQFKPVVTSSCCPLSAWCFTVFEAM